MNPKVAEAERILMSRVAARDTEAGAQLFDRHVEEIARYLEARARPHEVDDLVQEVFTRALRGATRFRGDSTVRTWLFAIARYTLYERRRAPFDHDTLSDPAAEGLSPESLIVDRERQRDLVAALEQLPDAQAVIVHWHRLRGMSHLEIAGMLGIDAATSRKRLERALGAVRSHLGRRHRSKARHTHLDSWAASLDRRIASEGTHGERSR